MDIKSLLKKSGIAFTENEPMRLHTTFKIGGNADLFILPENENQVAKAVSLLKSENVPYTVIGNGSNLLVSDSGIKGAVISLCSLNTVTVSENTLYCGAGALLATTCKKALESGLTGLEFAYGIPASIGGAVFMNAGAYGGAIGDVILSATVFDGEKITEIGKDDMALGYRKSIFRENGYIILGARFALKDGDKEKIKAQMDDYISRRREKQPLEYPSAGSVFKRPEGNFAGALIEKSGLKGCKTGGAEVSEKHAGFIINRGGATAADVKALIEHIKNTVYADSGIMLEEEVISL